MRSRYANIQPALRSAPRRWLVTGAAGFIGYHVAKRLLDDGHEVVGVDNLNDYYDPQLKRDRLARLDGRDGFRFRRLDVADRERMAALFAEEGFDRVIHLAAQAGVRYSLENPHAYVDANLVGFINVLEGCRHAGLGHLVYASSSSVYGANTALPFSTHHNVDHPVSLYAATKKANELMAHRLITVQECDRIYVLEDGRVVDQGTFDELASGNASFRSVAKLAPSEVLS